MRYLKLFEFGKAEKMSQKTVPAKPIAVKSYPQGFMRLCRTYLTEQALSLAYKMQKMDRLVHRQHGEQNLRFSCPKMRKTKNCVWGLSRSIPLFAPGSCNINLFLQPFSPMYRNDAPLQIAQ